MYLTQFLHRNVRQTPDALAARDHRGTLTWGMLANDVMRFAGALRRDGLQPGDRVAMLARNSRDYLVYVLGTLWAGGVINPVNLRWTAAEIAFSLNDCDTRFLICDREFLPLVPSLRSDTPNLRHVVVLEEEASAETLCQAQWLEGAADVEDAVRRGDDLAAIMYTGGTTGRAKGVMLSHSNLAFSMLGAAMAVGEPSTERPLHVAPLFHIGALSNLFMALATGATSSFLPSFVPSAFLAAIEQWQITEIMLVPTMLRMVMDDPDFARHDLTSVRRVRYGSSMIDEGLLHRAMTAFPQAHFVQAYGMTELSPVATILRPSDHVVRPGPQNHTTTAGRATPICEVRILGSDGMELPRGSTGEIAVRGPNVMLGYWNLPEATGQAVRDGWMHTGDVGFMDSDGYVTIVDRLKDMIVTGGENVYSAEVEKALATHPAIEQVAVIALPDPKWGERVHAVVVLREGDSPSEHDLVEHCRRTIAGYKLPKSFAFVAALPLSASGKPLKAKLREDHLNSNKD